MNPMTLNQDNWQRRESAKIPDEFFIIPRRAWYDKYIGPKNDRGVMLIIQNIIPKVSHLNQTMTIT